MIKQISVVNQLCYINLCCQKMLSKHTGVQVIVTALPPENKKFYWDLWIHKNCVKLCNPPSWVSKYLMLLVQYFLHTLLLVVYERGTADLIHEEQDSFVTVPQVLLGQNPHPELEHCCSTDTTGLWTLHHVTLEEKQTFSRLNTFAEVTGKDMV